MKNLAPKSRMVLAVTGWLLLGNFIAPADLHASGVTIITHGYNSDANGWLTAMADEITNYPGFPGTNSTIYKVTLTTDGTSYYYQWSRDNGSPPSATDSGEIIVKLDWSQMSGGSHPYDIDTYTVASVASFVLLQTNSITDLGGHALAEFPIHLVGHSRGGSLVSEVSRILGTNGVWVDQVTTLDPYPFNNDGNFDPFFPTDASASNTYANVLYADNYWQDVGGFLVPTGEAVSGAYVRQLTNLSSGYSSAHSDVHLWYHGTIDLRTPASYNLNGDSATIDASMRTSWWVPYEDQGGIAGFRYSLIGGGNRLSPDPPLGAGYPVIRNGYNQNWDLGAGASGNRTALAANNGDWPSLIKLDRMDTNPVVQNQSLTARFYYQWAHATGSNATISLYLDNDFNPFNTNQTLLLQTNVPGTGAGSLGLGAISAVLAATNVSPGWHSIFARISGGGQTRYLYAPEMVQVLSIHQPPALGIVRLNPSQFSITVNGLTGQTVILQSSPDFTGWQPIATNTLSGSPWVYTNTFAGGSGRLFFRAMLAN